MKKLLATIVVIIILLGGFLVYTTRPVEAPPTEAPNSDVSTGETVEAWSVDSSRSSAKFELDEELRGSPFHVVGETSAISGDVAYDAASGELLGLVSVDGATIKTDSTNRDGAIARLILHTTDENKRFITFEPKSVANVPPDPVLNTDYTFTLSGVLTINGASKDVTWNVIGRAAEGGAISGIAKTTVKRGDFGLVIPSIPFVANVSEEVDLTLNFAFIKK